MTKEVTDSASSEFEFDALMPAEQFAYQEDRCDRLWTPHRMAYINHETPRARDGEECPFCVGPTKSDEDALIVYRGKTAFALMNLFPYNSAHMLVCPFRHVSLYEDLTPEEMQEIAEITANLLKTIRKEFSPDGFNLGINQGSVAGAGIAAHLHQHIVPRWSGDANFLPIIGQTKAIPVLLSEARSRLANTWKEVV